MSERPRLLFNGFAQATASHHYKDLWTAPWARDQNFNDLATWVRIAKNLEDAKFDGLFLADAMGLMGPYAGSHKVFVESAFNFPNNDAIIIAAALAGVTENLSLGFTSSLIQNQPFELARLVSTLDHLSKGRVGWNVVTSAIENSYRNLGFTQMPTHDERYARADEFMDVVYALWEGSWDDDAVKRDWQAGLYTDPTKVHRIDHHGEYYDVQGPHMSEPSPQKTPFIYTAGMSANALRLAAKHAEGLLIQAGSPAHAGTIVEQVNGYLAEYGRRPEDLKVIQLIKFVVGSTEEEAERKYKEIISYTDPEGDIIERGGILGMDLGLMDPDAPIDIDTAPGFKGVYGSASLAPGQKTTTIREIVTKSAVHPTRGTPEQIVAVIEEYQDAGITGFNIADFLFHDAFKDFGEQVMPALRARGLAQSEYAPGTFREKVFGAGPHLNERHLGASHRGKYTNSIA